MKVAHVITGLDPGGAEKQLASLVVALRAHDVASEVMCLRPPGAVAAELRAAGVRVDSLHLTRRVPRARVLTELRGWLRARRPQAVHTWLYHADLAGGVAARSLGIPVLWSIHVASLEPPLVRTSTRMLARTCGALSSWLPRQIAYCSEEAARAHRRLGYPSTPSVVIPNGVDTDHFHFDPDARTRWRRALDIPTDARIIGTVARFHPAKDFPTLLAAARTVTRELADAHLVLVGPEPRELGDRLPARVHALGAQSEVAEILSAFDLFTLCSRSEAMPVALLEAMATGLPAVVTAVGDMPAVVGDAGWVTPPGRADLLAATWIEALDDRDRSARGAAARARAVSHYGVQRTARAYAELYRRLL